MDTNSVFFLLAPYTKAALGATGAGLTTARGAEASSPVLTSQGAGGWFASWEHTPSTDVHHDAPQDPVTQN